MFVKPKDSRVYNPETKDFLPEKGSEVSDSEYWRKRLMDGSVEKLEPTKPKTKGSKSAKPKTKET